MKSRLMNIIPGTLILISLILAVQLGNLNWLWLAAFVGANLFQRGITNWCLLGDILDKLGVKN